MSEFETVNLYFKQVYTCKTQTYNIKSECTIAQLYDFITPKAYSDDFGIDSHYKIEIVEAGQFNNVNGRDAELAPALNTNSGITLRDKYGDNVKNKSFYIRPKLFINIPPGPAAEDDTIPMAPRS
jgi:hypothetical protein